MYAQLDQVKEYYGKILQSGKDLRTSSCCSLDVLPSYQKAILNQIHPQILEKFYGCGSPMPEILKGRTILDLGCGSGRDVYLAAGLAGPGSKVIGVDMTAEQLETARMYQEHQMRSFGLDQSNVEFRQGYLEDLGAAGIEDNSIDLVISNCVINLSPDKERALSEILRVLKPGGELYFADVFADRRIPAEVRANPLVYGECLGGALYIEDFRRIMQRLGIMDHRVIKRSPIAVDDAEIAAITGNIKFESITIRAFNIPLEDQCEDFGQIAIYRGSIPEHPHRFILDDHHIFESQRPLAVCGNTADMLLLSAYGEHFEILGDKSRHHGLFPCGPAPEKSSAAISGACC
jgi:ubiquinone/menaquinone biosynthesis C-methylase UbiE